MLMARCTLVPVLYLTVANVMLTTDLSVDDNLSLIGIARLSDERLATFHTCSLGSVVNRYSIYRCFKFGVATSKSELNKSSQDEPNWSINRSQGIV